MSSNTAIVAALVDGWKSLDVERIVGLFTDDAVYQNIPIEPISRGKEEIRKVIAGFVGMAKAIDFVVHHTAEGPGGIVMNERTDRFQVGDRWIELPVMGVFEIRDGKIAAWRDYFDVAQFQKQMGS